MKQNGLFAIFFASCVAFSFCVPQRTYADTSTIQSQIDANDQQISSLESEIAEYQKQLNTLGAEKNTLQSTISSLTISQKQLAAQIQITQNKITSANSQIQQLTLSIGDKETAISADQDAISKALRSVDEGEQTPLITGLLSSQSLDEAWQVTDEAVQFNRALMSDISDLQNTRTELSTNRDSVTKAKTDLMSLQTTLNAQNKSLVASKNTEQQLLAQTKNSESNYQKLLATAQAQLASFSAFTVAAGGSKLLTNQTVCDSWGCYYNQRDVLWGNLALDGTQYRLASDGCLVTSMAMVLTHYGYRDVTPVTINSNPNNFAAYYPAYLMQTVYVDGISATRVAATIDSTIESGNPVIVGLHAYGGTHFVVLVSGSGGIYAMRDPYIANGKDVSFTAHYSLKNIYAIDRVVIK
jgi:peptidoglycan hydrolase CwlO-like protein